MVNNDSNMWKSIYLDPIDAELSYIIVVNSFDDFDAGFPPLYSNG